MPAPPPRFLGDLTDPWVRDLADVLPTSSRRLHVPGPLDPATAPDQPEAPCAIHRAILTEPDVKWLRHRAESRPERGRTILILGAHARYHQVQRCAPLVDAVLPEATARETLPQALAPRPSPPLDPRRPQPPLALVGSTPDLLETLAEACRDAGHPTRVVRGPEFAGPESLVAWEAPVLEPAWAVTLRRAARGRTLVALIGLADRELVRQARQAGAAACLDLPCNPADLVAVIHQARSRATKTA